MFAVAVCAAAGLVAAPAWSEPPPVAAPRTSQSGPPAAQAGATPAKPATSATPAAVPAPATPDTPAPKPQAAAPPPPVKSAPISSVFGQTAWQPPAPTPPPPAQAALPGGVPVSAPSSAAEASLRVSSVHLIGLIDHAVEGSDHSEVGHVVDVLVDDKGDASAVVIEIAGFMGVGNRHIALATDLLTIPADLKSALRTVLSPAQLRSAPTYDAKPGVVTVVSGAEAHAGEGSETGAPAGDGPKDGPHPDHAPASSPPPPSAPAVAPDAGAPARPGKPAADAAAAKASPPPPAGKGGGD